MAEKKSEEKTEEKKKIKAKPLPVDKTKASELEKRIESKEEKIEEEVKKIVEKEIEKSVPSSPETSAVGQKKEAAEKIAEEVVEETEKAIGKIAKEEIKTEKSEVEKPEKKEKAKTKKHEAIARGSDYPLSKKHSMYICRFIKNKNPDEAIFDLQKVIALKIPVPFKGEIPHRRGGKSGRYPVKAAEYFINLLKALKGNAIVNGLELENTIITESSASWARRPMRRDSRLAKRTNIILKAREIKQKEKGEKWLTS